MNSKSKNNVEHKWIPWRRYVLFLSIDNSKKKISRLPRRDSAIRAALQLIRYRGYEPDIFDTKTQTRVNYGIVNHEIDLPVLRK